MCFYFFSGICWPTEELNDEGGYFDLPPVEMTEPGIFHYLCTINNNFSNRSQKGTVMVQERKTKKEDADPNIAMKSGKYKFHDRGTFYDM